MEFAPPSFGVNEYGMDGWRVAIKHTPRTRDKRPLYCPEKSISDDGMSASAPQKATYYDGTVGTDTV